MVLDSGLRFVRFLKDFTSNSAEAFSFVCDPGRKAIGSHVPVFGNWKIGDDHLVRHPDRTWFFFRTPESRDAVRKDKLRARYTTRRTAPSRVVPSGAHSIVAKHFALLRWRTSSPTARPGDQRDFSRTCGNESRSAKAGSSSELARLPPSLTTTWLSPLGASEPAREQRPDWRCATRCHDATSAGVHQAVKSDSAGRVERQSF